MTAKPTFVCAAALMLASFACTAADLTSSEPGPVLTTDIPPVDSDERIGEIALVVDLELGTEKGPEEALLYGPTDIAVDQTGNMYILDARAKSVVTFGSDGEYTRRIGGPGQGPGEFESPRAIAVAGSALVVAASRSRLSIWNLDGSHRRDAETDEGSLVGAFDTQEDVVSVTYSMPPARGRVDPRDPASATLFVAQFELSGEQASVLAMLPRLFATRGTPPLPLRNSLVSVSRDGTSYVAVNDEYAVRAISAGGEELWKLEVPWEADPVTSADIDRAMDDIVGFSRRDFQWPERFPAITFIAVDGHGHLYVSPRIDVSENPARRPVDVFSPEGVHLFSGMMPRMVWDTSLGDFVYVAGLEPGTNERIVRRYRLIEPF